MSEVARIPSPRASLCASESTDASDSRLKSSIELSGSDFSDFYFKNRDTLDGIIKCDFVSRNVIRISPRADSFGKIHFNGQTIDIFPKFFSIANDTDFHTLTKIPLILAGPKRWKRLRKLVDTDILEHNNTFEFYFFLILNDFLLFLRRFSSVNHVEEEIEIVGVKGRIDFSQSIAKNRGQRHKHICIVPEIEDQKLILGIIKWLVHRILPMCELSSTLKLGRQCNAILKGIDEVKLTTDSLASLVYEKRKVTSDRQIFDHIFNVISSLHTLFFKNGPGINHVGFNINMANCFENILGAYLGLKPKPKGHSLVSGNQFPERLLDGELRGVELESNDILENGRSIIIKPDYFMVNQLGDCTHIVDAKYKLLNLQVDDSSITAQGVSGDDIKQLLTYWIHFSQKSKARFCPRLSLIYPAMNLGSPLTPLGNAVLQTPLFSDCPLHSDHLEIGIWGLDLVKAVRAIEESLITGESDTDMDQGFWNPAQR